MTISKPWLIFPILAFAILLSACGGGQSGPAATPVAQATPPAETVPATAVAPTREPAAVVDTPTSAPTATPTPNPPTATPTPNPTATPTPNPTATPTAEPTPAPSACANPYLPVAAGKQWRYQLSGSASDQFTRSIVAVTEDGFTDRDDFASGVTREGAWRCDKGNLIALTPGSSAAVTAADTRMEVTVESNSGVTLPADLAPGQTWSQQLVYGGRQTISGITLDSRNDLTTTCKAIREEQVTTPAGTFTALRAECTYAIRVTVQSITTAINSTGVNWYVRDVGLVKSVGLSDAGATEIVLLATP